MMKILRKYVRHFLLENTSDVVIRNLIELLVSNNAEIIRTAIHMGETLDYFEVIYASKSAKDPGYVKMWRGKPQTMYPRWVLKTTPEFFAHMKSQYPDGVSHNIGSRNVGWTDLSETSNGFEIDIQARSI